MGDFYRHTYPKAKKPYECECCENKIEAGEQYSCETGKFEGELYTRRLCLVCSNILTAYLKKTGEDTFDWWNIYDWIRDTRCAGCEYKKDGTVEKGGCGTHCMDCGKVRAEFSKGSKQ